MFVEKMFKEKKETLGGREARVISDIGLYNLTDTLECGQCFRHELVRKEENYTEYIIIAKGKIINVAQRRAGELLFFGLSDEDFYNIAAPLFSLGTDFENMRRDIMERTDSEWLRAAAEYSGGIAILKQDEWEALFSFIISQNNNIPRIRGIIRKLSSEYGVNICLQNSINKCPLSKIDTAPCDEKCRECGICYTFPTAEAVAKNPEKMNAAKVGFRYKYLLDAAERVTDGRTDIDKINATRGYTSVSEALKEILGVGEKVAACTALFGFGCLDAFPVDVWMKRAIDEYFDGVLDPESLGPYAGLAQQYIFYYIRHLSG